MLFAANITIIDSGVDMKHEKILPVAWSNPLDMPNNYYDEDRNGYLNDVHGWNFAENNNKVIDYKYLNIYTEDHKKFFLIQARFSQNLHTPFYLYKLLENTKPHQNPRDIMIQ